MFLDICNGCVYRVLPNPSEMLLRPLRCLVWGLECSEVKDCYTFKEGEPIIFRTERLERQISN